MKSVEFHPEAETEFAKAAIRYQSEVPGLGGDFEAEVRRVVRVLQEHPLIGAPVVGEIRHFALQQFRHSVVYIPRGPPILILAVAHASRRPQYWIDRIDR